ncbi:MAG: CPBP family intramembrane metalloprotease [Leptolyngbyaceae cyanobacterium RU_5_1]|nr:CPBP family intramembrane metalloprotease [Leptolyngbyaceae cyanobacterium RU_5_1]
MRFTVSSLRHYPAPARIIIFTGILLLLWLPIALPVHVLVGDRNTATILTLVVLYSEFIWLIQYWGRRVHQQPRILWHYGLELSRRIGVELLAGLGLGAVSVLTLYGFQSVLGWLEWGEPAVGLWRVILEGLLVALGVGFAEELLFRGWLLDELQRDYVPTVALWTNAILFATLHLRLQTFPAYVVLGASLVWAKGSFSEIRLGEQHDLPKETRRERLGLPIGLHAGLVWGNYIIEVARLVEPTNRFPGWVTGIDRNPLAGMVGLLFLAALAFGLWQFAKRQR